MENTLFWWLFPRKTWGIFYCYVSLREGKDPGSAWGDHVFSTIVVSIPRTKDQALPTFPHLPTVEHRQQKRLQHIHQQTSPILIFFESGLFFKSNQEKLGWRNFQLFSPRIHPPNPWGFMIPPLTCAYFPKMDWFNHQLTFVVWKVESYVAWIYHPATVSTRMTWMPWIICRIRNPNGSTDSIASITGKGTKPTKVTEAPVTTSFPRPGPKIPAGCRFR